MIYIIELINNIPLLLNYFIPGYIFIACYRLASFSNKIFDSALICKSIVSSYIISLFWKIIWDITIFSTLQILIICIISFILGMLVGFFVRSKYCKVIFTKLKIDHSLCDNIWVETIGGK